jgi:hypothetical protein
MIVIKQASIDHGSGEQWFYGRYLHMDAGVKLNEAVI